MKWHAHRLGRYVCRLTDEYTAMYIHRLIDKHTGYIFVGSLYLRRFRYRGIYMSYIPRYRGIKKMRNVYCFSVVFVAIPSNSNHVTLVKSGCNSILQ
jgi:hypothetical protein